MTTTAQTSECLAGPCPGCVYEPSRGLRAGGPYRFGTCGRDHGDEVCEDWRMVLHDLEDHRLCDEASCPALPSILPTVVPVGVQACEESGKTYAVVSLRTGVPVVHGTHQTVNTAKPHRTRVGKIGDDRQLAKRTTFVVCAAGHLH